LALAKWAGARGETGKAVDDLFQTSSINPKDRGMLWRHAESFLTSCVMCQTLWVPAGRNTASPGPSRRIAPFSSVTNTPQ